MLAWQEGRSRIASSAPYALDALADHRDIHADKSRKRLSAAIKLVFIADHCIDSVEKRFMVNIHGCPTVRAPDLNFALL